MYESRMKLLVGLGNPGAKYAQNRHNIGFMAVDRIAADHGFGPWRTRFRGEMAEGRFGSDRVMLLKPMTFMNLSGDSVAEALRVYAAEMRDKRLMRAEEKAARLPAIMTVPLILFFLPVLFIVILTPAIISIQDTMAAGAAGG